MRPTVAGRRWRLAVPLAAATVAGLMAAVGPVSSSAAHAEIHPWFEPGNLVVSGSDYVGQADLFTPGVTELPPGCPTSAGGCTPAVADGTYPYVFNNDAVDGSFGVTSPIFLDQITPDGHLVNTLRVPDGDWPVRRRCRPHGHQLLLQVGAGAEPVHQRPRRDLHGLPDASRTRVDVSNSNTPGVIDPTNPVPGAYYRVVAEVNQSGRIHFTLTNAYSGNNGRAAILNNSGGNNVLYTAGNAGTAATRSQTASSLGAGAQIMTPQYTPEALQTPGAATPVGSFNVTQLGDKADKIGKDTNFRGLTIYNNVVYFTKGSGGNGVNTVYFIDTTGKACPNGVGVPQPGATLPTSPIAYNPALLQSEGVTPYNMCVLQGFPTDAGQARTGRSPTRSACGSPTRTRCTWPTRVTAPPPTRPLPAPTPTPPRRPLPACRSGCSTAPAGPWPTPCLPGSTWARLTSCRLPDWRQRRDWPALGAGHRRPAEHHRPGQPERHGHASGRSPQRSPAAATRVRTRTSWWRSPTRCRPPAPGAHEQFVTVRSAASGQVLRGVSFTPGTGLGGANGRYATRTRCGPGPSQPTETARLGSRSQQRSGAEQQDSAERGQDADALHRAQPLGQDGPGQQRSDDGIQRGEHRGDRQVAAAGRQRVGAVRDDVAAADQRQRAEPACGQPDAAQDAGAQPRSGRARSGRRSAGQSRVP